MNPDTAKHHYHAASKGQTCHLQDTQTRGINHLPENHKPISQSYSEALEGRQGTTKNKLIPLLGCHQSSRDTCLTLCRAQRKQLPFGSLALLQQCRSSLLHSFYSCMSQYCGNLEPAMCPGSLWVCTGNLGYLGNFGNTESPPPEKETKNACPLEHPTLGQQFPTHYKEVVGRERIKHSKSLLIPASTAALILPLNGKMY